MSAKNIVSVKTSKGKQNIGLMSLTVIFSHDGDMKVYPDHGGHDPMDLAYALQKMLKFFVKNPDTILCAADACNGECGKHGH